MARATEFILSGVEGLSANGISQQPAKPSRPMTDVFVVDVREIPSLPVIGQKGHFPVHRIDCVGRNYAALAREMGKDPEKPICKT